MAFSYKDYSESDKVKKYATDLANYEKTKPLDWTGGTYGQQVNDALNKVLNREKFTYDLAGDALYNQYKDQYVGLGKLAMKDTMGQASALTGGYGNSYASTAGNQAYQGYLSQLNAVVPELYSMAREAYDKEGDNLANQYALIKGESDDEYAKYRDKLGDWNNERDILLNLYNNERDLDYNRYNADRNLAYQIARDAVADEQWQKQYDLSVQNASRSGSGGGGYYSASADEDIDDLRNVSASASDDTRAFIKEVTKSYGKNEKGYTASNMSNIQNKIDQWYRDNRITLPEVKELMIHYGFYN